MNSYPFKTVHNRCVCGSPGDRTNVAGSDLSDILPEEVEAEVKLAAEISMGTEVSEQDIGNIMHLCDQVCLVHLHRMEPLGSGVTVVMMMTFVFSWNESCRFSVTTSSEQSHLLWQQKGAEQFSPYRSVGVYQIHLLPRWLRFQITASSSTTTWRTEWWRSPLTWPSWWASWSAPGSSPMQASHREGDRVEMSQAVMMMTFCHFPENDWWF